jgi:hypothetical protein
MPPIYCGSWLVGSPHRSDGGLTADQSLPDEPHSPVGAGLPAKAACQSTNLLQVYTEPCGSWPAGDGGLTVAQSLAGVPGPQWELACRRWRLASRPFLFGCISHSNPTQKKATLRWLL